MLIPAEHALWCEHLKINRRGVYTDGNLIDKAIAIATVAKHEIQAELCAITGGALTSTDQVKGILAWLRNQGCELSVLKKAHTVGGAAAD